MVRAQRPTSVEAGRRRRSCSADGTIEGFVGGDCAEHSVRAYALQGDRERRAVLLRILPFGEDDSGPGEEVAREDGAVTVENPCLSGGAIEVFLEPVVPAPRVLVVGDTPIAGARAARSAPSSASTWSPVDGGDLEPAARRPRAGGRGARARRAARRCAAASRRACRYVGLVASGKRGDGVLGELRGDGVPDELLERIDVPAGPRHRRAHARGDRALDPGRIVEVRRAAHAARRPVRGAAAASTRSAG